MAVAQQRASAVTSGGLEVVKWVALACMVVDHVNAAFFARELPEWATITGRVAFPLFALVFAYNLTRPGLDRMAIANRLVIAAAIAQPLHGYLFQTAYGVYPLNILFLFAGFLGVVELLERGRVMQALAAAMVLSGLVEFHLGGVLLCVTAWAYFRRPGGETFVACLLGFGALCLHNGNAYALLALPAFGLLARWPVTLPRARWAFYVAYPGHLALLAALCMAGVGAAHG